MRNDTARSVADGAGDAAGNASPEGSRWRQEKDEAGKKEGELEVWLTHCGNPSIPGIWLAGGGVETGAPNPGPIWSYLNIPQIKSGLSSSDLNHTSSRAPGRGPVPPSGEMGVGADLVLNQAGLRRAVLFQIFQVAQPQIAAPANPAAIPTPAGNEPAENGASTMRFFALAHMFRTDAHADRVSQSPVNARECRCTAFICQGASMGPGLSKT